MNIRPATSGMKLMKTRNITMLMTDNNSTESTGIDSSIYHTTFACSRGEGITPI